MNESSALIAEQLRHNFDLIRAEINQIKTDSYHQDQIDAVRLVRIEQIQSDHETRLRLLQESSTQFKVLASLATGGGLLSVISLLRELFK